MHAREQARSTVMDVYLRTVYAECTVSAFTKGEDALEALRDQQNIFHVALVEVKTLTCKCHLILGCTFHPIYSRFQSIQFPSFLEPVS